MQHRGIQGVVSGHAPGHLRDAFIEAVDDAAAGSGDLRRADWTRLWNCSDVLPAADCRTLDLRQGSTYAMAVRSLS